MKTTGKEVLTQTNLASIVRPLALHVAQQINLFIVIRCLTPSAKSQRTLRSSAGGASSSSLQKSKTPLLVSAPLAERYLGLRHGCFGSR